MAGNIVSPLPFESVAVEPHGNEHMHFNVHIHTARNQPTYGVTLSVCVLPPYAA